MVADGRPRIRFRDVSRQRNRPRAYPGNRPGSLCAGRYISVQLTVSHGEGAPIVLAFGSVRQRCDFEVRGAAGATAVALVKRIAPSDR